MGSMSLSRDALLFSIVLMLFAVREAVRGYSMAGGIVLVSLLIGVVALAGSAISSLLAVSKGDDAGTSAQN